MLIKSFFRKKITKIYFVITVIIMMTIFLLFSFIDYYYNLEDELNNKYTTFVIESNNDPYKLLQKYDGLDNIERVLTFSPDEAYNVLSDINSNYSIEDGTIISDIANENKISWSILSIANINNKIVVVADESLKESELGIGIMETYYNDYTYNQSFFDNTIGEKIGFYNNDISMEFIVEKIYPSKFSELSVSPEVFSELLEQEQKFTYRADVVSYRKISNIKNELSENDQLQNPTVVLERFYYGDGYNTITRLQDLTSILTIASYIFIFAFLIFIVITNKNQIYDMKNNLNLERKIGYSKISIKLNLFKRLFLLYTLSFIIALLILPLIFIMLNNIFDLNLIYCNFIKIISLYVIVLLIIIIQLIIIKNYERR